MPQPRRYDATKSREKYTFSPAWRSVVQITWSTPPVSALRRVARPLGENSRVANARAVIQARKFVMTPRTPSVAKKTITRDQTGTGGHRTPTKVPAATKRSRRRYTAVRGPEGERDPAARCSAPGGFTAWSKLKRSVFGRGI